MKKITLFTAILTFNFFYSTAQTTVPGGIVNGIWTLAGSPYNVMGSIQIVNGDSLTIQPGVTVSFQGAYKFLILGKLKAQGTILDTITFTASNPTTGWRGIRFDNTASTNDTSRITYCKIEYGKASGGLSPDQNGGGLYFDNVSKVVVSNSKITKCSATSSGGGIYIQLSDPLILNNKISYNTSNVGVGGGGVCVYSGNPIIMNNTISQNFCSGGNNGGGIQVQTGRPLIINNTITNNTADGGGGIYIDGIANWGNLTISGNTVSYNTASSGGGINIGSSFFSGQLILKNNIISHNTASNTGGGVQCHGKAIVDHNTISNNSAASAAAGVECYTGVDTVTVCNNLISNNTVTSGSAYYLGGGGIWCVNGNYTIYNNVISNNSANHGAGVLCYESAPLLTNNTIVNNSATVSGGALYCTSSGGGGAGAIVRNCIFRGNTATTSGAEVFLYDESSDPSFSYCDVEGGSAAFELNGNFYTGTYQNNIDTNAFFVSPSGGSGNGFNGITADWSLQALSPCIDMGDLAGTYPSTDIAGNTRVSGGRIDMGAYEFQSGTTGISTNKKASIFNLVPNPSAGKFSIQSVNGIISKVEIYNMLGELVYSDSKLNIQISNEIDLSSYLKGVYFVKIYEGEKINSQKISVQ